MDIDDVDLTEIVKKFNDKDIVIDPLVSDDHGDHTDNTRSHGDHDDVS